MYVPKVAIPFVGQLHSAGRDLQPVAKLRRHPGLLGQCPEHHRLVLQQPGRHLAGGRTWKVERPRHGKFFTESNCTATISVNRQVDSISSVPQLIIKLYSLDIVSLYMLIFPVAVSAL